MNCLKRWLTPKSCAICNKKPKDPERYVDDAGREVLVCRKCVGYAERRAMRKR
ncbi:hypothetical protein LCM20_16160 [Halobacillus litoralis]|uniref:hypothetical protein n=1 Tax=Halobacillus litoralis TaxID=45668 RepID=UPI001CD381C8|nr:hypothetical protein [Halobacillus litoralis]MCA0972142.1 hypothetical protein [Halobacillus litoralis]